MKKALIFMMQPPGSSGVQANVFNKLLPLMEKHGWELHFVGPDPSVASLYLEPVLRGSEVCHYTRHIAPSLYFSIKRNRIKEQSLVKAFYGACQAVSLILEKAFRFDPYKHLEKGLIEEATKALRKDDYQLIAGYHPDFRVLKTAYAFALSNRKAFLALVTDPYGGRGDGRFYPSEPEKQRKILDYAKGAVFMSSLTREWYVEQGIVAANKAFVIYNCFPDIPDETGADTRGTQKINLAHFGTLASWRPIDSILQAFEVFQSNPDNPELGLDFYGYVYPEAVRKIKKSASLSWAIHIHKEVVHSESHEIAVRSDVLVVVIGPRHIDNVPSKFFEYLCHPKPVLVIGPKGNPVQEIVATLGIGVYSDINDAQAVFSGLSSIADNYDSYKSAYEKNKNLIREYSAEKTASRWAEVLNKAKGEL